MASLEELEERVAALEAQLRAVRADAAAARVLAGGADRDVSAFAARLDVLKSLLEALRATQVEQGRRLGGVEQRLGGVEQRLGGVEQRLGGVEQRLDALEQRLDALEEEMRSGFATLAVGQAEILALLTRIAGTDGV